MTVNKHRIIVFLILLTGILFRFYYINFGLPHSVFADEPRVVEFAIRYTSEARSIFSGDFYKLIPMSFVYGAFPTYVFWALVMVFSKVNNLLNVGFDATSIYVFLRSVTSAFSFLLVPIGAFIYKKVFRDWFGTIASLFLLALNWKLIVHAHYVNQDIILTTLLTISILYMISYFLGESKKPAIFLAALFFGLSIGTKITALLTLPLFVYLFFVKKNWRGVLMFISVSALAFLVTNPFAIIFSDTFLLRILEMVTKEAGLVFDSVNTNPFKYILAVGLISTPLVFLVALYGKAVSFADRHERPMHIFLIGHVVLYILFFSLGSRRVDRWLLPVLPIILIYASYGISLLKRSKLLLGIVFLSYLYFPIMLLTQFQRYTPKSNAYLWFKGNIGKEANVLVITEEGQDPFNKMKFSEVMQFSVYTSEGAQYVMPPNPYNYDYVVLSSRTLENYKRKEVVEEFPFYTEKWQEFEDTIMRGNDFDLLEQFTLPKPNLVPFSDVFIYKKLFPRL